MRLRPHERARVDAYKAQFKGEQRFETNLIGLAERVLGGRILPTQQDFIFGPERVKWYVGPVGCAKTSTLVTSVIIPALLYPGSRWFVGRWTWWTLEQTTLQRFMDCLNRLGPGIIVDKRAGPPMQVWIASGRQNEDGSPCEPSEIVFHGLDDLEKLGSTEFTGIAVDEANEITEHMATTLNARLRHKLPSQSRAEGPFFLSLASNPTRRSHWLHRKFCGDADSDAAPWGRKFKPHPKENELNLPPGYYDIISAGYSPEMRLRFVEGECGPDPAGQPVFPEFRPSLHMGDLKYIPGLPMIRGWDFGRRRPAVVWAQRTPEGWVNRLLCELGDNESLADFAAKVVQRSQIAFPGCVRWTDFVDPHGTARRDTSDFTSIDVLRQAGIQAAWRNVSIREGLDLMSKGLCTLSKGRPVAMYDKIGCSTLIEGYTGGYSWPEPKPGQLMKDKPVADGYYEHLMDADRYIAVNLALGSTVDIAKHMPNLRRR